jgi:hypothetical protein
MRKLIVTSLMVFCLFSLLPARAADRPDFTPPATPEEFVRKFYQWYFKTYREGKNPDKNDKIYSYVAKDTVDAIREFFPLHKFYSDFLYFTKFGEMFSDWDHIVTTVHSSTKIGDIFITPVTFSFSHENYDVIVILKNENGKFYINSVMDIYHDIL